jgi:PAS domain S-box-containing protein
MEHQQSPTDLHIILDQLHSFKSNLQLLGPEELSALSEIHTALGEILQRTAGQPGPGSYLALVESISDGLFSLRRDWTFSYLNNRTAQNFSRRPEDLVGKNIWEEFPVLRGSVLESSYRQVMDGRKPLQLEMKGVLIDHWFLLAIYPSEEGITVLWMDFTTRKQTEMEMMRLLEENQHQRDLLEAIFDADPSGVAVLVGPELHFAYVNPIYRYITPNPEVNPVGVSYARVWPVLSPYANRDRFREVLETGRPFQLPGIEYSFPNGDRRTFLLQARRIAWGSQPACMVILWDITEQDRARRLLEKELQQRREMEGDLQASERRLKLFVEYAPSAIAMLDCDMRYIAASQRYLVDYHLGQRDLAGLSHYDVFPEIQDRWKEIHQRCLAGAVEKCEEDPFPRADGHLDWVRWEIHPWYSKSGAVGGLMLFSEVITEHKQADELRQATNEIDRILYSTLDYDQVLTAAVSMAAKTLGSETAVLSLREEGHWVPRYTYGFSQEIIGMRMGDHEEMHALLAVRERKPVAIQDAFNDERVNREHMRKWNIRSVLVVPVTLRDRVIGVIFFNYMAAMYPFKDIHLDFASRLAASISLALENAHLFYNLEEEIDAHEQAEQALRESEARAQASLVEMNTVFESINDGVMVFGPDGKVVRANPVAYEMFGGDAEMETTGLVALLRNIRTLDGRAVPYDMLPNSRAMKGEKVQGEALRFTNFAGREYLILVSAGPIYGSDGQIRGAVVAWHDITGEPEAEALVRRSAGQIEVQHRLIDQREQERVQIARDLHDGPVQDLTAASLDLKDLIQDNEDPKLVARYEGLLASVQQAVQDLRGYAQNLRAPVLSGFGLVRAIQAHLESVQEKQPGLAIQFLRSGDATRLPGPVQVALYRIYQESMQNISRHAHAWQVRIELAVEEDQATLEVADDGPGFVLPKDWVELARAGHLGLVGMRERAEAVGGTLLVESSAGAGTKIRTMVPLLAK